MQLSLLSPSRHKYSNFANTICLISPNFPLTAYVCVCVCLLARGVILTNLIFVAVMLGFYAHTQRFIGEREESEREEEFAERGEEIKNPRAKQR